MTYIHIDRSIEDNRLPLYGTVRPKTRCQSSTGQGLGEHNLWEKMTVFETATRVGLVVRAPWLPNSVGPHFSIISGVLNRTDAEIAPGFCIFNAKLLTQCYN